MATAVDELTQALQDVASGKSDSQPDASGDTEVTQALKETLKPADSEVKTQGTEGDKSKTVPYDRFSKVIAEKNEALERLKALEQQFQSATERETSARSRMEALEKDHQILEALKGLAKDPRYQKEVVKLDRALQGIHEEVEKAEEKGDEKAVARLEAAFNEKLEQLNELTAEQNAQQLWNESTSYARELLASLPEEYTHEDKAVLARLWTPQVDWDAIEEQGRELIPSALKSSLAKVVKEYGPPRGAVAERAKAEVLKNVPEAKVKSNEAFEKEVKEKDWASMKDGKFEQSDADFSAAVGELLRRSRA